MPNIQIVIDAMNNASDELGDVKTDIEGVGKAVDSVGTSSGDAESPVKTFGGTLSSALGTASIIAAGVTAVAEGIVAVYEAAKDAASLDFAKMQFDNLASSIGTTASVLKNEMHDATGGAIADADLIAGASYAMATGVASSADEVVRLAEISRDLNIPMTDVVKAVNGTSMAMKNMGVDVSAVKGRVEELIDLGWDANTAKITANMEALEAHVTKVGSAADSELDSFQRADAVIKNIGDNAKGSTDKLGGFFAELVASAGSVVEAGQNFSILKTELQETGQWTQEFENRYKAATGALGVVTNWDAFNSLLGDMGTTLDGTGISMESVLTANQALVRDIFNSSGTWEQFKSNASLAGADLGMMTEAAYYAQKSIGDLNATPLEDKEATAKMEIDTSEVDNYDPEDKYATVHYSPGGGDGTQYREAVGGAVYGGQPYTWQEYGYKGELFVPSSNGFVMSRADAERALSKALTGGGAQSLDPDAIGRAVARAMSGVTSGGKGGNVYNLTMPTSNNPADVRTAFELMEAWA